MTLAFARRPAHSHLVELERIVRILRGYGHPEGEAVDIARRILAVEQPTPVTARLAAA